MIKEVKRQAKVGEYIRIDKVVNKIFGETYYNVGEIYKVIDIENGWFTKQKYAVIEANDYRFMLLELEYTVLEGYGNVDIRICREGDVITAYMNGKSASAKCHPDDVFDVYLGAKLALDRLFDKEEKVESKPVEEKKTEGIKVLCVVGSSGIGYSNFTAGKIYTIKDAKSCYPKYEFLDDKGEDWGSFVADPKKPNTWIRFNKAKFKFLDSIDSLKLKCVKNSGDGYFTEGKVYEWKKGFGVTTNIVDYEADGGYTFSATCKYPNFNEWWLGAERFEVVEDEKPSVKYTVKMDKKPSVKYTVKMDDQPGKIDIPSLYPKSMIPLSLEIKNELNRIVDEKLNKAIDELTDKFKEKIDSLKDEFDQKLSEVKNDYEFKIDKAISNHIDSSKITIIGCDMSKAEPIVTEVKRKPEVGEYVKVIDVKTPWSAKYKVGEIYKVFELTWGINSDYLVRIKKNDDPGYLLNPKEFVVLEGYKPPRKKRTSNK